MEDSQKHLEHLAEIRSLMERSTRFLSLSGLSGVWAGGCALVGAFFVRNYVEAQYLGEYEYGDVYYDRSGLDPNAGGLGYEMTLMLTAVAVLAAALAGGWFFTARKARLRNEPFWDASSRRLFWALMVPLITGGIFCLALLYRNMVAFLAPSTLVFYGLALLNGSKFTLGDVRSLGLFQIGLGLAGMFVPGFGLELWAIGFGLLHILYGAWMYYKYDKA